MNVSSETEHLLFPTPIWEYQFEDLDSFNNQLSEAILSFDWHSYKQENALDFGNNLETRNEDTFIPLDKAPGIMHVLQLALEKSAAIADKFGWPLDNHSLKLTQYWANVNEPNDYNMRHHHIPSHLSGVYYVKVPEQSGDIRFFDDRRVKLATEPEAAKETPLSRFEITFQPKEGMMLIFPSWLEHIVGQNKSSQTRIAVSFNIDLVKNPENPD